MKNKEKKIKENRIKRSKGEITVKIIAAVLALLMLLSVCMTLVYYCFDYFKA